MTKTDRRHERKRRRERREAGGQGRGESAPPGAVEALDRVPGWAVMTAFALATLLLFREFVFSDVMLFGSDTLALGYMARAFYADALQSTGFPLWNPIILGGTPFIESLAGGDSLHPLSVLLLLLTDTYRAIGWKLVLHVFLAGVFMFAWLRVLGTSRGAAAVGGLAFLLAPHMVTLVFPGHDGKIFVVAMTPILFWAGEWFLRRGGLLPLAALAGVVATVILSTHFQMAYFLFGAMGAYMLFRCIQLGRGAPGWRMAGGRLGAFLLFSVLGAGVTTVQLLPAFSYVTEDSRRAGTTVQAEGEGALTYGSSWSLHPEEIVSLAVPEFVGASVGTAPWTDNTYWGRNPFKLNHEYLGLVVLLLALLAFVPAPGRGTGTGRQQDSIRWFLLGLGVVVLLFTLGRHTPVWRIFYEVVPGISLFRAPSMAIFLTGFAAVTLAALGVDRAARAIDAGEGRWVFRLLGGGVAILAVGWVLAATGLLPSIWTSTLYSGLEPPRLSALESLEPHMVRGFGVAVLVAGLLAGLWWAVSRSYFPAMLLVPALAFLIAADQWRVNAAFIEVMDYRAFASPDQNLQFLIERQAEGEPFRVLSLQRQGQDVNPGIHGLELAGGHHPNDLLRYRELLGQETSQGFERLGGRELHPTLLDILNVRYILWPELQRGPLEGVPAVSQLRLADGRVLTSVYEVPHLPRARVVGEAIVVDEGRTLETVLDQGAFDPTRSTVLSEPPPIVPAGPGVEGSVRWVERTPNRLVFDVEASAAALVVVSENWFPAWRASVDGVETPVLRADHTLRAVAVEGGSHRVEMWYDSPELRSGLWLSILSLVVVLLVAAADPLLRRWQPAKPGKAGA
ncbi:MAG: hypothetical protein WD960_06045 [Gemmatimonadota bacterium]